MRPADASIPRLMSDYRIDRLGLLKVDIEGGEFAVLSVDELATAPALGEFARRGSAHSFKAIVRLHYKIKREHPLSDG